MYLLHVEAPPATRPAPAGPEPGALHTREAPPEDQLARLADSIRQTLLRQDLLLAAREREAAEAAATANPGVERVLIDVRL